MASRMDPGGRDWSIDPRIRLIAALSFAVAVVSLNSWRGLAAAVAIAAFAAVAVGPSWSTLLRRLLAMDSLLVLILVSLPFTVPGEPFLRLGSIEASHEGLFQALMIAVKANAVLLMVMALVGSFSAITLAHALRSLHAPPTLAYLLLLTVRYLGVIGDEYGRLRRAMAARAFRPRTDWHTLRSLGWLVAMLLVRSFERAERVTAAMKCRGFTGQMPTFGQSAFRPIDGLFALAGVAALGALFGLDHG